MHFLKINILIAFVILGPISLLAQQEYYEPDVDSAWVASQNGGSLITEDESTESSPSCIGDGCEENLSQNENLDDNQKIEFLGESKDSLETMETEKKSVEVSQENLSESSDSIQIDSTKNNNESNPKDSLLAINEGEEYEDCSEADSSNVDCVEIDDDSYDRYLQENADDYMARKEGFSRSIQLGIRVLGGINTVFGNKSSDWNLGFVGGLGFEVNMPLGIRHLSFAPELDFVYRRYNYEAQNDYSKSEAHINYMLFEIPVIVRYTFDEDNFFVGLGLNVDLKLTGDSKFKQKMKESDEKDSRNNTLPTMGVELGGVFNVGYVINRYFVIDLRVVQCFTNLLNEDSIAESSLTKANLYTFYTALGFSFVF